MREPNKYLEIYINNKKFKEFDKVSVFIKNSSSRYLSEKNDNYNILGIRGLIESLDYQNCLKKKNEIDRDISYLFPNLDTKENKTSHLIDQSGKSFYDEKIYYFKNGSRITLTCIIFEDDFKKKNKYFDSFSLNLIPKEIIIWLNEK